MYAFFFFCPFDEKMFSLTGENVSCNTFLICAPFYFVLLAVAAASQPVLQICKWKHQLA